MARARQVETAPPPPLRPPRELLDPRCEDWITPGEEPGDGDLSQLYRLPDEDDVAWRLRQAADRRYHEALRAFQAEHQGRPLDMSVPEHRRWLIGEGPRWRDLDAFQAGRP